MTTPLPGVRVLLCDDHPIVQRGLAALLDYEADLSVVGEVANGREAVELFSALRPDVILMDLRMPELDGVAAIAAIRALSASAKIIILTTFDTDEDICRNARRNRAFGCRRNPVLQTTQKRRQFARTREHPLAKPIAAVVLAAGNSSRMGRPKQLIEWGGQTLIRRTVQTVLASDVAFVVVTAAANGPPFEAQLRGLQWTRAEVENPQQGQSQSVRAGTQAVENGGDFDAILFTPCDLPLLSVSHLNALIETYRGGNWDIAASRYGEVLGAPLIVSRALWPKLLELRGDSGARKLLATHAQRATFIEWTDGQFDLDTPADVHALLQSQGLGRRTLTIQEEEPHEQ